MDQLMVIARMSQHKKLVKAIQGEIQFWDTLLADLNSSKIHNLVNDVLNALNKEVEKFVNNQDDHSARTMIIAKRVSDRGTSR